jgi:hypothetical protein
VPETHWRKGFEGVLDAAAVQRTQLVPVVEIDVIVVQLGARLSCDV